MEKIQELNEKLYREGVERGKEEAQRIVEEGKQQAAQIVADARRQAEALIQQAQKQATALDANTKSELKLYTNQALNALKSEVANVITDTVVKQAVAGLADNKEFIGQFAVALASKWVDNEPMVISTQDAESLKKYFVSKAKQLLDAGVTIRKVSGKDVMLSISPADGTYKIDFGSEQFETFFKAFLRPQLIEMLF